MHVTMLQAMDTGQQAVRDMSVQCALEDSCLVFFDDTSMTEALDAFDSTGKTVGMVQVRPRMLYQLSHCAGICTPAKGHCRLHRWMCIDMLATKLVV